MTPQSRYGTRLSPGACLLVGMLLPALVAPAGAVPVPYKNCGTPTDILHITSLDASTWPPPVAAPLAGTATIDPGTGRLTNLHVLLSLGVDWVFDSGSVGTSLGSGFVSLPASIPMRVTSPNFPLAAGPVSTIQTLRSGAGPPFTIQSKGALGQSIPTAVAQLSLKYNGVPGFPLSPVPGSYEAQLQMAVPDGAEIFCFDITLTDIAFVTAAPLPVPALPRHGLPALFLLVAATGLLAIRSRGSAGVSNPHISLGCS